MDLKTSLYELITATLYNELSKSKKLNREQIKRFKDYFSIESEDLDLLVTPHNLIITGRETFEELENFLNKEKITIRFEDTEHNHFVVVYPYFNDPILVQAIEG